MKNMEAARAAKEKILAAEKRAKDAERKLLKIKLEHARHELESEEKRLNVLTKETEKRRIELEEQQQQNKVTADMIAVFHPFAQKRKHSQTEMLAIAAMNETLMQALQLIASDLEDGMSNEAMKLMGDDHYRKLWLANGVQLFMDAIRQKKITFGALSLREEAKKKESIKQVKDQVEIRTMKHIYDRAPL